MIYCVYFVCVCVSSVCIVVLRRCVPLQQPQAKQLLEQPQKLCAAGRTEDFQPHTVWNRCTSQTCRYFLWHMWTWMWNLNVEILLLNHLLCYCNSICLCSLPSFICLPLVQMSCCRASEKSSLYTSLSTWRGRRWRNTVWAYQTSKASSTSECNLLQMTFLHLLIVGFTM